MTDATPTSSSVGGVTARLATGTLLPGFGATAQQQPRRTVPGSARSSGQQHFFALVRQAHAGDSVTPAARIDSATAAVAARRNRRLTSA